MLHLCYDLDMNPDDDWRWHSLYDLAGEHLPQWLHKPVRLLLFLFLVAGSWREIATRMISRWIADLYKADPRTFSESVGLLFAMGLALLLLRRIQPQSKQTMPKSGSTAPTASKPGSYIGPKTKRDGVEWEPRLNVDKVGKMTIGIGGPICPACDTPLEDADKVPFSSGKNFSCPNPSCAKKFSLSAYSWTISESIKKDVVGRCRRGEINFQGLPPHLEINAVF